ncbi:MAG TPA: hypothetical protein VJ227_04545 [Patescibacteria group bacterium]|nr:hypothetical protein [Patescibacteria group bacterium]
MFQLVARLLFVAFGYVGLTVSFLKARSAIKFTESKDFASAGREFLLASVGTASSMTLLWIAGSA